MLIWKCNKCRKELKRVYRINVITRNPEKTYGNGLPFISTLNRVYCKQCFSKTFKAIKESL